MTSVPPSPPSPCEDRPRAPGTESGRASSDSRPSPSSLVSTTIAAGQNSILKITLGLATVTIEPGQASFGQQGPERTSRGPEPEISDAAQEFPEESTRRPGPGPGPGPGPVRGDTREQPPIFSRREAFFENSFNALSGLIEFFAYFVGPDCTPDVQDAWSDVYDDFMMLKAGAEEYKASINKGKEKEKEKKVEVDEEGEEEEKEDEDEEWGEIL